MKPCDNPACTRAAQRAGLCHACYLYRRRTGKLRPPEVIRASARRHLMIEIRRQRERELAAVGMVEQWAEPKGIGA